VNCLHLALLTQELEPYYWNLVKQDYCDYYFFVYDLLLQRDRTKVFLALDRQQIAGLMLIYNEYNVQLRGSPETVGFLLSSLNLASAEVEAPIDCESIRCPFQPCCLIGHHECLAAKTMLGWR